MSRSPSPAETRQATEEAAEAAQPQPSRRIVLTPASAIDPEPVVWAWEDESDDDTYGRIPAGSFGLFAGREGTGKSSALIWLAARITRGELAGAYKGDPHAVIYMAAEDSWKFTIVPRLMAAGADLRLVYRVEVQTIEDETVTLSLPTDNKLLEDAITDNGVALVALDPLMSTISETLDTHVNRQVRQALDPLVRIADRTGAIVAGIAHFNKGIGTDAASLITASGAFKDVARFIFAFATDPENETQVITQVKNSLGRSNLPSIAYDIISAIVPTKKGDANVGRLVIRGEAKRSVHDILGAQVSGDEKNGTARAVEYLKVALANGPRPTREVEEEAKEAHGIAKRTLERARSELNLPAGKSGPDWWIALPEHQGDIAGAWATRQAKSANSANSAPRNGVGGVGGLETTKTRLPAKTAKTATRTPPAGAGGLGSLATPATRARTDAKPSQGAAEVIPFRPPRTDGPGPADGA